MSQQFPDPLTSAAQLLGAGGLGAIALKVVERIFARADRGDDVAAGLRKEMVSRLETLEKNYATLENRERETFRKLVGFETENRQLRRRYHALINWIAAQPGLPTPPPWLYDKVDGPTADEGQQPGKAP